MQQNYAMYQKLEITIKRDEKYENVKDSSPLLHKNKNNPEENTVNINIPD